MRNSTHERTTNLEAIGPAMRDLGTEMKLRLKRHGVREMSLPRWWTHCMGQRLPANSRAMCSECHGHGSWNAFAVEFCKDCHQGDEPCAIHQCRACSGSGAVCPVCRGMRFCRDGHGGIIRCEACCEGNNVSAPLEYRAIIRYLHRQKGQAG